MGAQKCKILLNLENIYILTQELCVFFCIRVGEIKNTHQGRPRIVDPYTLFFNLSKLDIIIIVNHIIVYMIISVFTLLVTGVFKKT